MSVITGVGKYAMHMKRPAFVQYAHDGFWFGHFQTALGSFAPGKWSSDGHGHCGANSITGPWIDEPDPGEGWRLLKDDETVTAGDQFCFYKNAIEKSSYSYYIGVPVCQRGMTVREIRDSDPSSYRDDPRVFRRRIERQFRISDKGRGVYETRNGTISEIKRRIAEGDYEWEGAIHLRNGEVLPRETWKDDGTFDVGAPGGVNDLVRYLRPLDEEWKPTHELRLRTCMRSVVGAIGHIFCAIGGRLQRTSRTTLDLR